MSSRRPLITVVALLFLTGCSGRVMVAKGPSSPAPPAPAHELPHSVHGPAKSLGIPPGHYPPPGYCRVWIPGRPPGRQAKAVPCRTVGDVPLGAWVLHRSESSKKLLEVAAYDDHKPRVVVSVSYYDASTGLRVEASAGKN